MDHLDRRKFLLGSAAAIAAVAVPTILGEDALTKVWSVASTGPMTVTLPRAEIGTTVHVRNLGMKPIMVVGGSAHQTIELGERLLLQNFPAGWRRLSLPTEGPAPSPHE